MKLSLRDRSAFTLIELLVVISIIGILATLVVPAVHGVLLTGQMTGTLHNAHQLHLATRAMSLDTINVADDHMEWTSISSNGRTSPASVATYFDALIKNNYLTQADLKKLVTAPGRGPGNSAPSAENSCFKFFQVDEKSPTDQPLLVTANWDQKSLSADAPYGKKGFVLFDKGGGGGIYRRATDVSSATLFPAGRGDDTYRYNTLN